MDLSRSEINTSRMGMEKLTIKQKQKPKKHTQHQFQRNKLKFDITPQQYRGMHVLGNFHSSVSWGNRHIDELQDHRVALLPSSLFRIKNVLDVGCGEGKVAIEIAMRFFPSKMVALDIDAKLLEKATKLADKIVSRNELYEKREEVIQKNIKELPLFFQEQFMKNQHKINNIFNKKVEIIAENEQFSHTFPENFCVCNQNFINMKFDKPFDTIIILSTSKWIHLAFGDEGLKFLFEKAYDSLAENGILVLEYPQYQSYKKKRTMNTLYSQNMKSNINIDPMTFPNLLTQMGFEVLEEIMSKENHPLKHPMTIFKKHKIDTNSQ